MTQSGRLPMVLGLELEEAQRRLRLAGAVVKETPCHSRKGVPGADCTRVIRQTLLPGGEVLLITSDFITTPAQEGEQNH